MQTYIVTGGSGFIGSNFILKAKELGWGNIINLDKLTYASQPQTLADLSNESGYHFVQGDIGDVSLVQGLLEKHKPSAIINFAAETHVDRSILDPSDFVQTNIIGTFNLLNLSKTYWENLSPDKRTSFRFLHISTDEVYGSLESHEPPFKETSSYVPNSPYAASKAASDHFVRAYYQTYGLPTITTHCSNNYGPRQFPEKLIPLIIISALDMKLLPIYGDGQNIRDWIYVEDHCEAIYHVLKEGQPGETYNIGGCNELTNLTVVEQICEILDELVPRNKFKYSSLITFVRDRPGHDKRYAVDCEKIYRDLGWKPKESFESGLFKTVQWYLDNADWVKHIRSKEYQNWMQQNYGDRNTHATY